MSIKTCNEGEEEKKLDLEKKKNDHLRLAEFAYKRKKEDKEKSKSNTNYATASFDLEKCLPTPYLRNGVSFYKRQLWTYNLTVYHTSILGSQGFCYLWNETVAKRGGQEIASCIRKFIKSISPEIEELHLYSDSWFGQNKNIYMIVMLCHLMVEMNNKNISKFKSIFHHFMEPVHTHMEADTIHASIETAKKRTNADIEVPHDWCNFIKSLPRSPPLNVIEVPQCDFLDFRSLIRSKLVNRKTANEDTETVNMANIRELKFDRDYEYQYFYRMTHEEEFKLIDLRKGSLRKRLSLHECYEVLPLNSTPLPLDEAKLRDLKSLQRYVSSYNQPYYNNLRSSADVKEDFLPYGSEVDEEEDL